MCVCIHCKRKIVSQNIAHFSCDNNSTLFRHPPVYNLAVHEYVRPGAFYYPEVTRKIVWYVHEENTARGGLPLILLGVNGHKVSPPPLYHHGRKNKLFQSTSWCVTKTKRLL